MHTATLTTPALRSAASTPGPLHVAIVDEELPYPPISGKRIRTLNLTLRLARRHRVTYVCHRNADAAEAQVARDHFAQHGIETVVVERSVPRKSGLAFHARLARNLFSPLPYSVATHDSRPMREALQQLAKQSVDLWHVEWTPYAHALRCLPGTRQVVMAHNVESLIWQRYFETESNPLKRWYIGRQWRKFQTFERRVLAQATRTIAVSAADAELFRRDFNVPHVDVVDNGVDTSYFQPRQAQRHPQRLLFLGSLEWRPNLDAVDQLLTQVFPEVRHALPEAECWLVGRNPPASLRQRAATTPGVHLHGDVADVRPFLANCAALVVPLRIGGGSRLKILEALAMETPVVSTRIGAEGLHLNDGEHLTLCEGIADMPRAILGALGDREGLRLQAERGREMVCRRYDWDALADRLEEVWLDCVKG